MVSPRGGDAFSQEAAVERLEKLAGTRFDPGLVGEFISALESAGSDPTLVTTETAGDR